MKKKSLNLLPEKEIFDIEKYFLIKNCCIFFIINIIILAGITFGILGQIKYYKKLIKEKNNYLVSIQSINNKFDFYKKELKKLKSKIAELDKKKALYKEDYISPQSPFIATLVLNSNLVKGVFIEEINFTNQSFNITGKAVSNKSFYNFYKNLKQDKRIEYVKFNYLKISKENKFLNFKISLKVKI